MKKLLFSLLGTIIVVNLFSQTVSTLAGSGSIGSTDATGTSASFYFPQDVAVDANGNVYVADFYNQKIRKINFAGVVSILAGSGTQGSTNATGTSASFNGPASVAVDANGNVYVADYFNHKIRKISPVGVVVTLAGSGSYGSTDGTATSASFNYPSGVAVDANGNVYVADTDNHKIRKISPAGVVTTLAGSGSYGSADGIGTSASFNSPSGLAIDANGNVYVADTGNHKIRKISPTGVVSTFAGNGTASSTDAIGILASFSYPRGVAIDANSNVYVGDYFNHKIRKISPTGVVSTFAGIGTPGSTNAIGTVASFKYPWGVDVDANGIVYVADVDNHKIRKITPAVLPVALTDFTATLKKNGALLTWSTVAELNNSHFVIEKSTDGVDFKILTTIGGKGTINEKSYYQFTDLSFSQSTYYRLTQIDANGTKTVYHDLVRYVKAFEEESIKVYPNPVKDILSISLPNVKANTVVKLLDLQGTVLQSQTVSNKNLSFNVQHLPVGVYLVQYADGNQVQTKKVVKH